MLIMAPADENECWQMLSTGFKHDGPSSVRYPRGTGPGKPVVKNFETLPIGKSQIRRQGTEIALLAFGSMVEPALAAGEQLDATVVNMRFVKPLDQTLISKLADQYRVIVTIEENVLSGGAGSAVNDFLAELGSRVSILNLGLPDHFIEQGEREELLHDVGLDAEGICAAISAFINPQACQNLRNTLVS
jgi:1-deoxy-D-xylulose-5-phosphate synthase